MFTIAHAYVFTRESSHCFQNWIRSLTASVTASSLTSRSANGKSEECVLSIANAPARWLIHALTEPHCGAGRGETAQQTPSECVDRIWRFWKKMFVLVRVIRYRQPCCRLCGPPSNVVMLSRKPLILGWTIRFGENVGERCDVSYTLRVFPYI